MGDLHKAIHLWEWIQTHTCLIPKTARDLKGILSNSFYRPGAGDRRALIMLAAWGQWLDPREDFLTKGL